MPFERVFSETLSSPLVLLIVVLCSVWLVVASLSVVLVVGRWIGYRDHEVDFDELPREEQQAFTWWVNHILKPAQRLHQEQCARKGVFWIATRWGILTILFWPMLVLDGIDNWWRSRRS